VDLGEAVLVSRVSFEVSDAPWVAQPTLAASVDGRSWEDVPATASLADAAYGLVRDPKAGRGEVRFPPRLARFVRLDARLPARASAFTAGP
jgi:hypothetical protein